MSKKDRALTAAFGAATGLLTMVGVVGACAITDSTNAAFVTGVAVSGVGVSAAFMAARRFTTEFKNPIFLTSVVSTQLATVPLILKAI